MEPIIVSDTPKRTVSIRLASDDLVVEFVADRPSLRVTLLADADELGISSARSAPGGPSPPPHFHRRHAKSFHVLEGKMTFSIDGSDLRTEAGSWCTCRPARFTRSRSPARTTCAS